MKKIALVIATLLVVSLAACSQEPAADSITAADLDALITSGNAPFILDVRTRKEFSEGHIPGAVNIPHTELESRIAELNDQKNNTIVLHCRSGARATTADKILRSNGFTQITELDGHMMGWQAGGHPVEPPTG